MTDRESTRGGLVRRGGRLLGATAMGLCVAGWMAGVATAQTFRFSSFEVQGNGRIDTASVLAQLGVVPGEAISAGRLNDGVQRLQNSGLFQSVEVVPQGNRLLVIVEEAATISRIAIEGNARLGDDALLPVVGSQVRRVYDPRQAERDAAAIAQAYAASGRLSATVVPKIIRRGDNRVDLVFEVAEGRVTEVERISFVGNRAYSDRRLRRALETKQAGIFRAIIAADTFVAERIAFDLQLLRDFYQSRGYIDFQVLSATPELVPSRDAYFLTIRIQEGQQYRFNRITTSSDLAVIDASAYGAEVRVRPGDIYSPQAIERSIRRLELLATRQGLDFIRVVPQITRNEASQTLDVDFVVERGDRVFVERIDIEGNATTLDRVIRRQFRTVEGDPFNPREIRAAAERIEALGYFSATDVEARQGTTPDSVIVDVDVEEQPTGSLGFGLNYSAETGAGISFSFAERNFLGRGQSVDLDVNLGGEDATGSISFVEPAFLNRDLALSFSLFYTETDRDGQNFSAKDLGLRTGLTFPVGTDSRLGLFYNISESELTANPGLNPAELSPILFRDAGEPNLTSSVGYNFSYSTIGSGLDPTRGIRLRFGQEFAGLGGDEKFVRTTLSVAGERAVRNEEITLRAALDLGVLTSLDDTVSARGNRFFNTGSNIRGFRSGGIGPRDTSSSLRDNDPLGGNRYAFARMEALFPIGLIPEEYGISGAVFLDAGSVWGLDDVDGGSSGTDGQELVDDGFYLNSAVGFSILWDTQIGPLRFNFSDALRARDFDRTQSFDLTIQTRF
ncbi:outer membrane protein assembly factor BamA [Jannaschia sp. LMIT008]|uniref:outer membrane protein assembly factor BamA n=1 Tax=Jannaschia maritima TaxID=3032585 RepID=UPI0028123E5C|nr:outer membrane protein assembly factor BamA [Jannaschia sp. LMIT008]